MFLKMLDAAKVERIRAAQSTLTFGAAISLGVVINESGSYYISRVTLIVTLCWLSMIGFDFVLHGGLLATFYVQPSPFLLPLAKAFRLIPLGYP